ncbi:MAG TPA: DUF3313 domain-containing protein [Thermoanaerobaculia bacterium]|nr:DUF3313 domain-containing protein [Thermoanaerobaculia bacterium]
MTRSCAVLAFLFLAGCATSAKQPNVVFLGSGIELQSVPGSPSMRTWSSRPGALADYHAFLFEPVVVVLGKSAADNRTSADELKSLSEHLRAAFTEELTRGGYTIVEKPGDGVLRVRAALTELVPVDPAKNVAAKAVGTVIGVGLFLPTVDIGQAAIEVDMRDSNTNARVAAFADRKAGRAYFSGLSAYRRWGDVESAFGAWAREFRVRLDQVHGVAK